MKEDVLALKSINWFLSILQIFYHRSTLQKHYLQPTLHNLTHLPTLKEFMTPYPYNRTILLQPSKNLTKVQNKIAQLKMKYYVRKFAHPPLKPYVKKNQWQ